MRYPVLSSFLTPLGLAVLLIVVLGLSNGPARGGSGVPPVDPGLAAAVAGDWEAEPADLSDEVATARLRAGILCTSWARDLISQHWRRLDRLVGPGTWSSDRQTLWLQLGWVDAFERRYLRPRIDADSQEVLAATWWPDGISTPAGSTGATEMHRFCMRLPGVFGSIDPDILWREEEAMLR
ncbi:hypothetical protein [Rhodovulum sulfidophilum]|uniref:hypothetical protein n=1 Tax=Rhodovulum sulfidophilum TaxID=35806 RepID=UPI00095161BE|nr:hypothetical protein [Rhodovulum sulfidophilum]OLS50923.1 hypothetical protein BV392_02165 [Rhodovulum sulfidophilum]